MNQSDIYRNMMNSFMTGRKKMMKKENLLMRRTFKVDYFGYKSFQFPEFLLPKYFGNQISLVLKEAVVECAMPLILLCDSH